MPMKSVDELLVDELRDLLDAEKQLVKALGKMIKAASDEALQAAFESHRSETEKQVEAHLRDHLARLPEQDDKSIAILERMAADEAHHGTTATLAGGVEPPRTVRSLMAVGGEILRQVAARL